MGCLHLGIVSHHGLVVGSHVRGLFMSYFLFIAEINKLIELSRIDPLELYLQLSSNG